MASKIIGIDNMSVAELQKEIAGGGKFIAFSYCISIIIMTFRRSSNIYFIKAGEGSFSKGIGFSLISFFFGWWGIPWGPIYTIQSLFTNSRGGKDVTKEVVASINQS